MSSAFFQLKERTRNALQNGLGWRSLRPVQELSIPAVLSGANCLILAPTAGGKTEAAMIPVLDLCPPPVGALYLSPLKALVNNQEERLEKLFGWCGKRVFKWHGDVGAAAKKSFLQDPADLLMTTPESLEVLLTAAGPGALPQRKRLLQNLTSVVIDEIHAFAGDDRGDHLLALLDRLSLFLGRDLQRIGLSATVGNPELLLRWLQGSSRRESRLVDPGRPKGKRKLEIHPLSEFESPALCAARLARGRKSLLFAESRSRTEELKSALQAEGVTTFVHHSAVSRELREQSERAFQSGQNCCIVCTSTMELGLDVGDLDLVVQYHCPSTVSAFLQRLGRTGRRQDKPGHMAFLTDERWSFLQTCALITLAMSGYVEPIQPTGKSLVVFLHQMLARVVSEGGMALSDLLQGAGQPYCFGELEMQTRVDILNHLIETDVLVLADGCAMLGPAGEKNLGKNNFQDLYSIFDTPRSLKVLSDRGQEIGALDAWFAQSLGEGGVFALGGRSWSVARIDWEQNVLTAEPAGAGKVATWMGMPRLLSFELCQEMKRLLQSEEPLAFLSERAQKTLRLLREEWQPRLRTEGEWREDWTILYTFAGGRINNTLGKALQAICGEQPSINNVQIKVKADPSVWAQTLEAVRNGDFLRRDDLVQWLPKARFSKYQDYLPPDLLQGYLAERLLDPEGAQRFACNCRDWIARPCLTTA